MEFVLNKIDSNLRQRINEAAKEGKVHSAKSIIINKDKNERRKDKKEYKVERYNKQKRLFIDVVKTENIEIVAFKENIEADDIYKGSHIDIKK